MRPSLLFDLDGTLVHTDHLHYQAFVELLARDGRTLSLESFNRDIVGATNARIFANLFPAATMAECAAMADAKEARVRELIASGAPLPPAKGLLALLDWADGQHVPYAIVTNAPPANAQIMLAASGLAPRFPIVVSGEELPHGKPHPLPYLEGLRRLGGDPKRSAAFEDSVSGLTSAVAAGVLSLGLSQGPMADALRTAGAHHIAADFTDADLLRHVQERVS
jgi:HAD superfamily hydrolase (TIGR01509 family)